MRLTPRRAVLALALSAAAVVLPAAPAVADDSSVYCFTQPEVYMSDDVAMTSRKYCVPWPFSVQPGS